MARIEVTQWICDLTGKEIKDGDHVTIRMSYGGKDYVLDTDTKGEKEVREAIAPILAKARVDRGRPARGVSRARRDPSQTRAIRAWAQSQGIAVSDRGRIPADIEAKYHEAMKR